MKENEEFEEQTKVTVQQELKILCSAMLMFFYLFISIGVLYALVPEKILEEFINPHVLVFCVIIFSIILTDTTYFLTKHSPRQLIRWRKFSRHRKTSRL